MDRIETNVVTGETQVIQLSPAEEALAIANHAATEAVEAPRRSRITADAADAAEVRADNQVQAFLDFSPKQLDAWIEANITGAGNKTAIKVLGRLAQAAARGRTLR